MSQSLARALAILGDLGEGPRTLDELAAKVGVHKTTVLRLLRTMEEERFVHRDADHRFHLGAGLFALAGAALEQRGIRDIAAPHLARLNDATGQTVHLGVYEGGDVVYLDKYDSRHAIRMYSRVGLRMPLHATAIAKVLLADLPEPRRRRAAAEIDYVPFTEHTITGPDALLEELARVAGQGYAMDDAEHETFIRCVAAPVRDASGRVVAAVSISVPEVVLSRDDVVALLPDLLATTRAISADCGHTERDSP
ncbi:IclR family transcriptional regulator [Actinomadura litoris]|uniref:Helix-turn-helix domain-containing protein n=1 Tax=Actinomadura litoris TaxID=2678616 RepID=A0A7K1KUG0_9ACTN|nr:IclR family transcriptional regulator [Actinomadura litoris]MUN35810.1 helix-turn-helix domain-containing protein [Actinomadura litoris]